MQVEFGTNPADLIAGIGPSIGPEVYEVGPEVIEMFKVEFNSDNILKPIEKTNKALLNLWETNKQILLQSGIIEKNIEVAKMCTYSIPELFYSARRDGGKCGRLASGILIKSKI
ncbi:MAG: hypothetical protein C0597_07585 [Marinilabiliales bacterium]|nr:MAG: hypothetical protein C0597_07585 [Marinilabiliales bacterium]